VNITCPAELKEARIKARLSRAELAEVSGVDRHVIGALERGIPPELTDTLTNLLTCTDCGAEAHR